ncbi:MAG: hypothetical protein SVY15_04225 [Halobacteriota archaeon]|nr:hypothetical protein [Halobacteriota archaeon]
MMKELEGLESELKQERKTLLQDIDMLVKDGNPEAAIKQIEEAANITDRLKGVDAAKKLEKEIQKLESDRINLETKTSEELKSMDVQEKELNDKMVDLKVEIKAKSKNLSLERDKLLENIESLVEEGKGDGAIAQVKAAGKLSEDIEQLKEDETTSPEMLNLAGKLKDLESNREDLKNRTGKELGEIKSRIVALRKEQSAKAGGLQVEQSETPKEPAVEETVVEEAAPVVEEQPVIEDVALPKEETAIEIPEIEEVQEVPEKKPELTKVEYLILNGIAEGFTTPKKLAKKINVDESFIKDKIEELTKRGYLGE